MAQTATLDPAREDAVRADAGREDAEQEEWPTEEQHLRALEHANRVRLARAEIKRRIRAGHLSVVEVIINCPWQVHSMEIIDLLMSQKRWGWPAASACSTRPGCRRTRRSERSPIASAWRS
jgi:hypothetical protein